MPSLTLTYSTADATRIVRALGYILYPRQGVANQFAQDPTQLATAQDFKVWLAGKLNEVVVRSERYEAEAKASTAPDIVIT
jgi:hypothetical protein